MYKKIIILICIILNISIYSFNYEENKIVKEYKLNCATDKIYPYINPSNSYHLKYYGSTEIKSFIYHAYTIKSINKKIICESNYEYQEKIYKKLNLLRIPKNNRKSFFYIINNNKTTK